MVITFKQITLVRLKKSKPKNLNQEIQMFSQSLGLFNPRDKEKSCFRIFIELLKAAKRDKALTSDELAYKLNLTRGTVVHHLNRLMDAGIVKSQKNKYMLRRKDLKTLVEEIRKDAEETLSEIKKVAEDIDKNL